MRQHAPDHCDLSDVIAVVGDELPQNRFECTCPLLVTGVRGFDLTIKLSSIRICELRGVVEKCGKSFPAIPSIGTRQFCLGGKTLGIMGGIRRLLIAHATQIVVHPVVHVEDELSDGVWETRDLARCEVGGKIFDAGYGIGVSALATEQFC